MTEQTLHWLLCGAAGVLAGFCMDESDGKWRQRIVIASAVAIYCLTIVHWIEFGFLPALGLFSFSFFVVPMLGVGVWNRVASWKLRHHGDCSLWTNGNGASPPREHEANTTAAHHCR
jgi:hypothetical protein